MAVSHPPRILNYTKDGEEKQEAGYQITKNYFFNPFAIAIK